jgi:hypothetical protein
LADLVRKRLDVWDGRPLGLLDGARIDDDVAVLAAADRPAGRLALLTAFAPYRVDAALIARVRAGGLDDTALIELTAWAAAEAAATVCGWLPR